MNYSQNQDKFYEDAMSLISADPKTRLSAVTHAVMERNNFVFDAHIHVFDGDCINLLYMVTRFIAGVPTNLKAKFWRILTGEEMPVEKLAINPDFSELPYKDLALILKNNTEQDFLQDINDRIVEEQFNLDLKGASFAEGFHFREFLNRLRDIIQLLRTKKMSHVYDKFRSRYAVNNIIKEKELISIALGMDLNKGWEGKIKKSNHDQIAELSRLADTYPVLPFLPLDPRRADDQGVDNLYEIFLNAFTAGGSNFFGVKFYPALGYLPSDYRLEKIFKICAEKKIPVVTHCGGEIVSTFQKAPFKVNRGRTEEIVPGNTRKEIASFLNEPIEWTSVLEMNPGLHLNLAHFGSEKAWSEPDGDKAPRKQVILDLMENHRVFSDFSFNLENKVASDQFEMALEGNHRNGELMRERTMFGTDYWVVLPKSDLIDDQEYFLQRVGENAQNMLVRNVMNFLQLNP